jgi:hypothetical protein
MVLKKIILTFEKDKKNISFLIENYYIYFYLFLFSPILRFIVNSFYFVNLDFKWSLDVTILNLFLC